MNTNKTHKEFQVALLMEDIADAKIISDGLREIGIFAHYYEELDDFWVSLNSHTPDFCIIDVKRMSQGTLLFKQHPKVKSGELKFSFFFKESNKILLNSTYGLNHYGLISAELDPVDQLKAILRRRNVELGLKEKNITFQKRIKRLQIHGKRLTESLEQSNKQIKQHDEISLLTTRFGQVSTKEDFYKRVIKVFGEWDNCFEFGIYHLNSTNQKLISPKSNMVKYKTLPDLWLSEECNKGISEYATEMAYEVSYGIMDENLVAIRVTGSFDQPDVLIIGKFNTSTMADFNWTQLETKLNAEYRRALVLDLQANKESENKTNVFEVFQMMDDIQFHRAELTHRFALIDFSKLASVIKQRHGNQFSWKGFSREFTNELNSLLDGEFKLTNYGAEYFIIALDRNNIETNYNKLKAFAGDFQYWRYFEDSTLIVSQDLAPEVKFVAPSSVNILRQTREGFINLMQDREGVDRKMLEV